MPSKADSKLITNFILIRTEISPWYIINMFLLFLVAAGTYGLKYYYLDYFPNYWIIEPITMGIWSVICYLFIFSLIVSLSNEKKLFPLRKKNDYQYLKELNVALENDKYKSQTEDQEYMNDLDTAF
jgi:fucose 4-O-acetylase-like acetyltransferase